MTRSIDARLGRIGDDNAQAEDDGGLQQQRHPSFEDKPLKTEPPKQLDLPEIDRDDTEAVAEKRAMDRVRTAIVRGHALNQGRSQDLLPGL